MSRHVIYMMNGKGTDPMAFQMDVPTVQGMSESDVIKAIELSFQFINSQVRQPDTQLVVVEDGLVVAVEGLTSGKLLWVN